MHSIRSNYIAGVISYMKATLGERFGCFLADELVIAKRYQQCSSCSQSTFSSSGTLHKCKICGCFLTKKIILSSATCPLKVWYK